MKANRENPRAPKVMERGEVGWAGGGKGPDYFIYMGRLGLGLGLGLGLVLGLFPVSGRFG